MPIAKDKDLLARLKNSPYHRDVTDWLAKELAVERDIYESSPATEGQRQRVLVLREILDALKDS